MAGRPTLIDAIVGADAQGNRITVADRIINGLAIGQWFEHAVLAAGVGKSTVYGWLSIAAKARIRTAGNDDDPSLTPLERQYIAFSDAVERSTAQWHTSKLTALEQLERGGTEVVTVTEKLDPDRLGPDGKPVVLERTRRTEVLGPDAASIRWRLKHRFPAMYAERVEVTGAEGGPVELSVADRANALADSLEEQQRKDAEALAAAKPKRKRRAKP